MDAMVNRSRKVDGKPTSLLDLGYNHVGVDGGCVDGDHVVMVLSGDSP